MAQCYKRARLQNSKSVFLKQHEEAVCGLTADDREFLKQLCATRNLDQVYFEGASVLYMRSKSLSGKHSQKLLMLACVHITVKFCAPPWVTKASVKLHQAQEVEKGLNVAKLCALELDVLHQLNWQLF